MNLDDLAKLAAALPALPDDRPQWLKNMPYASQPGSDYYRFLWELVKRYRPARILEIGIDKGASTLTLAAANLQGQVVSMDISRDACLNALLIAGKNGVHNLSALHHDSLSRDWEEPFEPKADLLFLDSLHTFSQVYQEYVLYRKGVKDGGIILFDDIRYSKEMEVAWSYIMDPKIELPSLHHTSFGACKVDKKITPLPWETVKDEAKEKYSK